MVLESGCIESRVNDTGLFAIQRHIGDPRAQRGVFGLSLHVSADISACKEFRHGREQPRGVSHSRTTIGFPRSFSGSRRATAPVATFDPFAHWTVGSCRLSPGSFRGL